jgi:hypothetical protein
MNTVVTERNGRKTVGQLLYLYTFPYAIQGKDGNVLKFEDRPQRVGIVTAEGEIWHFTVPAEVKDAY